MIRWYGVYQRNTLTNHCFVATAHIPAIKDEEQTNLAFDLPTNWQCECKGHTILQPQIHLRPHQFLIFALKSSREFTPLYVRRAHILAPSSREVWRYYLSVFTIGWYDSQRRREILRWKTFLKNWLSTRWALHFPDNHQRLILYVLCLVKICALYICWKIKLLLL